MDGNAKASRQPKVPAMVAAGLSAAVTLLVSTVPAIRFAYRAPTLHIFIETAEGLIGLLAAYLFFVRFRERRRLDDLFIFGGLAALSVSNLAFSALPDAVTRARGPAFTTWAPLGGRLLGAALVGVAAFVPPRRLRFPARSLSVMLASSLGTLGLIGVVVAGLGDRLSLGIDPAASPEAAVFPNLTADAAIHGAQLLGALVYAVAAWRFIRLASATGDDFLRWVGIASVFATFSRINYFLYPSLYSDWVYIGDFFRVLFYVTLLVGAVFALEQYWRDHAAAVVLEERRRVARDLHDGLAQELAYIVRRAHRARDSAGAAEDLERIAAAAERAIVDSRLAIAALTRPIDEPLDVALAQALEEVAGRTGASIDLHLTPGIDVGVDAKEALIRIAAEAVGNAARHASAGSIRVQLTNGPPLRLRVTDDGVGFDPDEVALATAGRFGLQSMRQRAAAIEARLEVSSRPGGGTSIEVVL
jgi:signal transduction histidine kinase